jgi:hypothetical protein
MQVVLDYLAGDAAAAPLIARLPSSLLCRHTAAVGAELLAHRARLTDALSESVAAAAAACVWAEMPEVAGGVVSETFGGDSGDDSGDPQFEDDVDHEVNQARTEGVAAQATFPAGLTALGLVARQGGGDDTWKEIEVLRQGGLGGKLLGWEV